ncbi:hypothetical protein [Streptomyces sp. NPDC001348]
MLLFQGYRRNRALTAQLQAEITAQKIEAIRRTRTGPTPVPSDPDSDSQLPRGRCRLTTRFLQGVRRVARPHRDAAGAALASWAAVSTGATVQLEPYTGPALDGTANLTPDDKAQRQLYERKAITPVSTSSTPSAAEQPSVEPTEGETGEQYPDEQPTTGPIDSAPPSLPQPYLTLVE